MQTAKKVYTQNPSGKDNGWLMELYKQGEKTLAYLTAIYPKAFKGFHLHRVRTSNYVCLRGIIKITLWEFNKNGVVGRMWEQEEHILHSGEKLDIPTNIAIGLKNIGEEEAWLVNMPNPAYDPDLKDEQVEYSESDLLHGIIK